MVRVMAGMFTEAVLNEIKARVDIVDLIGSRMTLKRAGSDFKGCCPFHHEKTPSFVVHPDEQFYKCFGCGEAGDAFKFLMKMDGLTFQDAVQTLADRVGVAVEKGVDDSAKKRRDLLLAIHAELAAFYRRCLLHPALKEAEPARRYLETRRLSGDTAESFGIGYAPARYGTLLKWAAKHGYSAAQLVEAGVLAPPKEGGAPDDLYDRFCGRLMFPIRDARGRVVAFSGRILEAKAHVGKYVNSPETGIFTKGRVLYALDKAAKHIVKHPRREAIVCEGQIDVIRCHACGFETAVASQGTAFTEDQTRLLKKYADCAVLVFDGDDAGRKAALKTGRLFLAEDMPVRVAVPPPGEDPDSLLREKGPDAFRDLLDRAVSLAAFQIDTLRRAEKSPDSIDAVKRMSDAALDTVAACSGAVLRAALLQELALLLHLPLTALETQLERHAARESRSQRSEVGGRRSEVGGRRSEVGDQKSETGNQKSEIDEDSPLDAPPAPEPPSRNEILLCEFLIEHEHDDAVLALVERHLPPDLISHSLARAVVDALLAQRRSGGDRLAELCRAAAPAWQPLLRSMLANAQKMLGAKEMTKDEAVRDYIRRMWITGIERRRGLLPAVGTPETENEGLRLSSLIKELKTKPWERIAGLMTAEGSPASGRGVLTPAACPPAAAGAAAAASSARAADTASGAGDPEEFPPSEYPPDETPD
jgi:DNA primase